MGISESEYRAMLANNDQLIIKDDGTHKAAVRGKAKTPLVACSHLSGPAIVPTEHEEQVALFQWAEAHEGAMPELRNLVAFPNGGYRPMATAAALKAEGVKAGLPDLALLCRRGGKGALFIEMKKADHSNKPTAAQAEWIERLRQYGYQAVVCYGAKEAIDAIQAYLGIE
jgi:hypothetical protein